MTRPGAATPPAPALLAGTSTLLIGSPGTGKTTSLVTFIEAGLELFVTVTDPNGVESLIRAMQLRDLPMDRLHWQYIPAASASWDSLIEAATTISNLSYKGLTDIKSGIRKSDYRQFLDLYSSFANFTCDRTGEEFGPIDHWGPERAHALDGISGTSKMVLELMIGGKPIAHEGEYGVAMQAQMSMLGKLCSDLRCFRVAVGHIEREPDMLTGAPKTMVSALGRKNAPKLPKDYSDVVLTEREGDKFFWSNITPNTDLKAGVLPLSAKLAPTFVQVVEAWGKWNAAIDVPLPQPSAPQPAIEATEPQPVAEPQATTKTVAERLAKARNKASEPKPQPKASSPKPKPPAAT